MVCFRLPIKRAPIALLRYSSEREQNLEWHFASGHAAGKLLPLKFERSERSPNDLEMFFYRHCRDRVASECRNNTLIFFSQWVNIVLFFQYAIFLLLVPYIKGIHKKSSTPLPVLKQLSLRVINETYNSTTCVCTPTGPLLRNELELGLWYPPTVIPPVSK